VPDPAIDADAVLSLVVDGMVAGRIQLEPKTDPRLHTCISNVWRTMNATDQNSWNTYERP
jgi:hypothetical protein